MGRFYNDGLYADDFVAHHGILGMKWGVRRFQNADGSLTSAGLRRYQKLRSKYMKENDSTFQSAQKKLYKNSNYAAMKKNEEEADRKYPNRNSKKHKEIQYKNGFHIESDRQEYFRASEILLQKFMDINGDRALIKMGVDADLARKYLKTIGEYKVPIKSEKPPYFGSYGTERSVNKKKSIEKYAKELSKSF